MTDIDHLERVARSMDRALRIPFTRIRFGWDSVIGLIPGLGDAASLIPAGYIIAKSRKMGAPNRLIGRMVFHTGVDAALGTIPLIGDVFDIGNKSNTRNVAMLRAHLETQKAAQTDGPSQSKTTVA
jgi:hypothetical protein